MHMCRDWSSISVLPFGKIQGKNRPAKFRQGFMVSGCLQSLVVLGNIFVVHLFGMALVSWINIYIMVVPSINLLIDANDVLWWIDWWSGKTGYKFGLVPWCSLLCCNIHFILHWSQIGLMQGKCVIVLECERDWFLCEAKYCQHAEYRIYMILVMWCSYLNAFEVIKCYSCSNN